MASHLSFEPGEALRVKRRWGYRHHGVYVGDGQVVQFGGAVSEKGRANIELVTLSEFARGGEVVVDDNGWLTADVPEPWPSRAESADRALWLVDHHQDRSYNLLGRNCETVANWCSTGNATSVQFLSVYVRAALVLNSATACGALAIRAHDRRRGIKRRWPTIFLWAFAARGALTVLAVFSQYRFQRFVEAYPVPTYRRKMRDLLGLHLEMVKMLAAWVKRVV